MREIYEDLADRRVPVQLELQGKTLIGTWLLKPEAEATGFQPPPPRTYSCHECGKPLTDRDTRKGIIGAVIDTDTGCHRVAVHRRCEDGPIGVF